MTEKAASSVVERADDERDREEPVHDGRVDRSVRAGEEGQGGAEEQQRGCGVRAGVAECVDAQPQRGVVQAEGVCDAAENDRGDRHEQAGADHRPGRGVPVHLSPSARSHRR